MNQRQRSPAAVKGARETCPQRHGASEHASYHVSVRDKASRYLGGPRVPWNTALRTTHLSSSHQAHASSPSRLQHIPTTRPLDDLRRARTRVTRGWETRSNSLSAQKHGETRLGAFLLSQTIARAAPFSLPAEDSASSQLNTPRAHTRTGTPLRVERYRCASARAPSRRHGRELGRVRGVSFASWNPAIGTEAVSVGQRLP